MLVYTLQWCIDGENDDIDDDDDKYIRIFSSVQFRGKRGSTEPEDEAECKELNNELTNRVIKSTSPRTSEPKNQPTNSPQADRTPNARCKNLLQYCRKFPS